MRDTTDTISVGGESIVPTTTVIMSVYSAHRDGRLWQRPDEFNPEHFLNAAAAEPHKYAFLPFGGGIQNCIGRHFAELEMMLIIAAILREFTIKTHANNKPTLSITYKPERDVMVSMSPIH